MHPLFHLQYNLDVELALQEAEASRKTAQPYRDSRFPDLNVHRWLIGRDYGSYTQHIMDSMGFVAKPRFYFQQPHFQLPEHVDNGTTCSVNFILTPDPAPVCVEGQPYMYRYAILDTTRMHSVDNGPVERILLKFSIFGVSYADMCNRLEKYSAKIHGGY